MINMVLHLYISAYVRSLIMTTATSTIELKLKYILKFNIIILKNINISDILSYLCLIYALFFFHPFCKSPSYETRVRYYARTAKSLDKH